MLKSIVMKNLCIILAVFASVTVYGKEIVPGPTIWYSISEKILKSSQLMVVDTECIKIKKKTIKAKVLKVSTKFQQKDVIVLPGFLTPTVAKNVWFLPE